MPTTSSKNHARATAQLDAALDLLRRAADDEQLAAFDSDDPHERARLLERSVSMRWRAGFPDKAISDARGFTDRTDIPLIHRVRLSRLADAIQEFEESTPDPPSSPSPTSTPPTRPRPRSGSTHPPTPTRQTSRSSTGSAAAPQTSRPAWTPSADHRSTGNPPSTNPASATSPPPATPGSSADSDHSHTPSPSRAASDSGTSHPQSRPPSGHNSSAPDPACLSPPDALVRSDRPVPRGAGRSGGAGAAEPEVPAGT